MRAAPPRRRPPAANCGDFYIWCSAIGQWRCETCRERILIIPARRQSGEGRAAATRTRRAAAGAQKPPEAHRMLSTLMLAERTHDFCGCNLDLLGVPATEQHHMGQQQEQL